MALMLVLPVVGSIVFLVLVRRGQSADRATSSLASTVAASATEHHRPRSSSGRSSSSPSGACFARRASRFGRRRGAGIDRTSRLPGVSPASVTALARRLQPRSSRCRTGSTSPSCGAARALPDGHDARRICPSRRLSADRHRPARRPVRAGHAAPRLGDRARRAPIRLLVTLWIAQNLLLVASTMLRTFDYIEAYSLTELRIAALIWMGAGRGRPGADLLPAAARQERRLADQRQSARRPAGARRLHLRRSRRGSRRPGTCAMPARSAAAAPRSTSAICDELGPSALLPLIELESRPTAGRAARARRRGCAAGPWTGSPSSQADWHGWTWRGAGRLADAQAIVAERACRRAAASAPVRRPRLPPPPPPVVETSAVRRGRPNAASPTRPPPRPAFDSDRRAVT